MGDYTGSTFWISDVTPTPTPKSLIMHPWNGFCTANWSCRPDYSSRQRWHILTASQLAEFDKAADTGTVSADVATEPLFPADIHDISGRLVRRAATGTDGLAPGIYIVKGRKIRI